MKKYLLATLLCCNALPTHCLFEIFHRKARHPLNEPTENPALISLLRSMPRIHTASQIGFIGLMLAYLRMNNKPYKPNHLALTQVLSPRTLLTQPLACIDDGLIGHPGSRHQQPYGILGTSWTWVPKIDETLIAIDTTKRKAEAWMHWMQKNLRALDDQSTMEQWWNQLRRWIHN